MQRFVFILAYPLLWLLSRLPFGLLYFISNLVYFFLYHILGYRTAVVRANLSLAFPDKSKSELRAIEKKFYRHLCDMFLEMIKTLSISEREMQRRFTFSNPELILELEQRKNIMLVFPHYASWEWVIALDKLVKSEAYAIYQRIRNRHFDSMVKKIRSRFGTTLIETRQIAATVRENKQKKIPIIYGMLCDQSPMLHRALHFSEFMGVKVPMHVGAESLSKMLDLAMVYLKVSKVKRGFYKGELILLSEEPGTVENYKLTDRFHRETEKQINEAPEFYFWTHRRWKHRKEVSEKTKATANN